MQESQLMESTIMVEKSVKRVFGNSASTLHVSASAGHSNKVQPMGRVTVRRYRLGRLCK